MARANLLARLRSAGTQHDILIVGLDGRSGSGKSSLARTLAAHSSRITVVHTDDLAWHHSFFGWADLLVDEILEPVRAGELPVRFRPDAWVRRGRDGAIRVPADTAVLIVEGVGACGRAVRPHLNVSVWIEASRQVCLNRAIARGVDTPEFLAEWHAAEEEFLRREQPWLDADIIVSGTSPISG